MRCARPALAVGVTVVTWVFWAQASLRCGPPPKKPAAGLPPATALLDRLGGDDISVGAAKLARACDKALSEGAKCPAAEKGLLALRAGAGLQLGRYERALTDNDAVLKRDPVCVRARCGRVLAMQALGRAAGAKAELQALLKQKPNDPDALLATAIFASKEEDVPLAIAAASKAIASAPQCAKAYLLRAYGYYQQNDMRQCGRDIRKAIALGAILDVAPPDLLYVFAADVAYRLRRPQETLAALTTAEAIRPGTVLVRYGLWRMYQGLHRSHMATYLAGRMVDDFPREAISHYAAARTALAVGHYAEAKAEAERALTLEPQVADPLVLLGRLEWAQQHKAAAGAWFDRALQMDPELAGGCFWKALLILAETKPSGARVREAVRLSEKGSALQGGHYAPGLFLTAYCEALAGDLDKAGKTAQAALLEDGDAALQKAIRAFIRDLKQGKAPSKPPSIEIDIEPRLQLQPQ